MPIDSTSGTPMKVGEHHEGLKKTVLFLTPIVTAYIEEKISREEMLAQKKETYALHVAENKKRKQGEKNKSKVAPKKRLNQKQAVAAVAHDNSTTSTGGAASEHDGTAGTGDATTAGTMGVESTTIKRPAGTSSVNTPKKAPPCMSTTPMSTPEAERLPGLPQSIFDVFMQI